MNTQSKQTTARTIETIQAGVAKKRRLATRLGALLLLAMMPAGALAETNSRSAQAVLHIQVTVMPVLLPAQQQPKAANAVTFDLRGDTAVSSAVTRGPMPARYSSGERQVLETTTVVAQ